MASTAPVRRRPTCPTCGAWAISCASPGGRAFVISVPGVMGSGLNDQQVADVANWMLATIAKDSVPQGHAPYDAAEVARARAAPLVDVAGRTPSVCRSRRGNDGLVIH